VASSFGGTAARRPLRVAAALWTTGELLLCAASTDTRPDVSVLVGVGRGVLAKLGAFADSWVTVSLSGGAENRARQHAAQLVYLGDFQQRATSEEPPRPERDDETQRHAAGEVLVSPMLWANLGLSLNTNDQASLVVELELQRRARPLHASTAIIAPVLTPEARSVGRSSAAPVASEAGIGADSGESLTDGLQSYFARPRALGEGDVFAVCVDAPWPDSRSVGLQGLRIPRLKYFKVVELQQDGESSHADDRKGSSAAGLLVSRERTTVSATGSQHAFLPRGDVFRQAQLLANWSSPEHRGESVFHPCAVRDFMPEASVSPGLRQRVGRHLRSVLQTVDDPHISPSTADALGRCAILIQGPSASEVQHVVNRVAASYGFNVFEQSWASLGVGISSAVELR